MTSKERVLKVFAGESVDRVPLWVGMSEEFEAKAKKELSLNSEDLKKRFGDDFRTVRANYVGATRNQDGLEVTCFDIPRHGYGYGMATIHPFSDISSITELENWQWPNADKDVDVSKLRAKILQYNGEYAIMSGDWSPLWHDAIDLVGMENLYLLMYDYPELVHAVFRKITDYYLASNRKIFEEAGDLIDIMFFGNDLGSQKGALLSPIHFRKFILPYLKELINLGHSYNLKVQMHCCGGISELLDDLIEAKLDSIQAIQCTCAGMDLESLKERFGAKIILNGGIDSHHILINSDVESVKKSTLSTLELMRKNGNYIAGATHDSILEETPVKNIIAMCDTINSYVL